MKMNRYKFEDFLDYAHTERRTTQVNAGAQVVDLFIGEGERNKTLTSFGGSMVKRGMSDESIKAAIIAENRARCRPPLPDEEVMDIVKSLSRYKSNLANDHQQSNNNTENLTRLPVVYLFGTGSNTSINDTAHQLGEIYSPKQRIFSRVYGNGTGHSDQIQIISDVKTLKVLTSDKASSEFETIATIKLRKKDKEIDAIIRENDAKLILESEQFANLLPPIRSLVNCPVIVESPAGEIKIINAYDRESGVFARGLKPPNIDVEEATEILLSVIEEFSFKTPADRSRCLSYFITPGLTMGGVGKFRSPIHFTEANESQTGKGFLTRITAAMYEIG